MPWPWLEGPLTRDAVKVRALLEDRARTAVVVTTLAEEFVDIEEKMGEILSSLEWKVLMSYLEGKSYQEMVCELKRHVKSIDNALQRVKRKLERYLEKREH